MRRRRRRRGASVAEALVAAVLAGIAAAGLAAVAALARQGLRLARDTSTAVALASEQLEALRAGPAADGSDRPAVPGGGAFVRVWQVDGGRGAPVRLGVRVSWGARAFALTTEAPP
jgi:Tfp pilus assembly protein PilV